MFTESSVESVLSAVDVVELIGDYTELKKRGRRFQGRCPFHEERTPSFSVNAEDGLYHCFGCGKGGNAVTFLRDKTGVEFADAIVILAKRFNVTLVEVSSV